MAESKFLNPYEYFKQMEENNIILAFKGNITGDLLTSILEITENKLEKIQEEPKVRRKVFNILVECLQNVYHHMDELEAMFGNMAFHNNSVIFMIGQQENNYFIITGNHILNDKINHLKNKIDKINSLNPDELKNFYKEVLTTSEGLSEKGGAGLGMIDIARKSGNKIEYDFKPIDEKFSFYSLFIKVLRNSV